MLRHAVLSLLIWGEIQAALRDLFNCNRRLSLGRVIGGLAFLKLLLHDAIEEAQTVVEVLAGNMAISQWHLEYQILPIVGQL